MLIGILEQYMFQICIIVVLSPNLWGQGYPGKPVRIVTAEAGGGSDFVARIIAQGLSTELSQQVIVDNRGGGSGIVAAVNVAQSPPDGYSLLFYGSPFWINPLFMNAPYDPIRDFMPITLAMSSPNILVVHPSLPVRSVSEFIALAKSKPGALNYGAGGVGGSNHLAAELFKAMAKIDIVRVPYKGSGPAINELVAGQLQLMFATSSGVMSFIKSGRLRAIAVTSMGPSALTPGLPTISSSGLPGYESTTMFGLFAPAKTPAAIITKLNHDVVLLLKRQDIRDKFLNVGAEAVGTSAEEFAVTIKSEMAKIGKLVKEVGIRADR